MRSSRMHRLAPGRMKKYTVQRLETGLEILLFIFEIYYRPDPRVPGARETADPCPARPPPSPVFFPRRVLPSLLLLAPSRRRPNLSFLNFLLISYRSRNRDRIKRNGHRNASVHRRNAVPNFSLFFSPPPSPPPPRGEERRAGRIHLLRSFSARRPLAAPLAATALPIDAIGIPDRRNAFFLKLPRWWRSVATTPSSSPPPPVKRGRVENSDNSTTIPASVAHPRSRSNVRTFEKLKRSRPLIPPLDIYLYIYIYVYVCVCVCTSRKYVPGMSKKRVSSRIRLCDW